MIGAIAGDIIGSRFEWHNIRTTNFNLFSKRSHFTDDSVMTLATAQYLLDDKKSNYTDMYRGYGNFYPHRGYGGMFAEWLKTDDPKPYNSFGNGSAMRVSPVAYYSESLYEVLEEAKKSAEVTHNHPEGIKGAQAIAAAIFLARNGESKEVIKKYIEQAFEYDLSRSIEQLREEFTGFDVTCQGSVPHAIIAFLNSTDFETAIRLAIYLGGDSDTIACMAGSIAEAFYKEIPFSIAKGVLDRLDEPSRKTLVEFYQKYNIKTTYPRTKSTKSTLL